MLNLTITDAALKWFEKNRWSTGKDQPAIATLVWSYSPNWKNPSWSAGFHERSKIPVEQIVEIGGIEFAFEPSYQHALEGKTVDLKNGAIEVIPNTFEQTPKGSATK